MTVVPQEEQELEPHERKKAKRAKAVDSSEEEDGQCCFHASFVVRAKDLLLNFNFE